MREAGEQLGMTPNAIRQRIRRGSLTAVKVDGIWRVNLPAPAVDHRSAGIRPGPEPTPYDRGASDHHTAPYTAMADQGQQPIEAQYRVTPTEIQQAIERTGDKYLVDMQAMLAPLVAQIAAQAENLGRVTAERDALQARLSALDAHQTISSNLEDMTPETTTQRAWWRFWER